MGNRLDIVFGPEGPGEESGLDELILRSADPNVDLVSVDFHEGGGREKDLLGLLEGLQRIGKNVELTIAAVPSGLVESSRDKVASFILDFRVYEDMEEILRNEDFHRTLGMLLGKKVDIRKGVGPIEPSPEEMTRLGEAVASVADSVILQQETDPDGCNEEAPASEGRMLSLGRAVSKYVPCVILRGHGFRVELRNKGL